MVINRSSSRSFLLLSYVFLACNLHHHVVPVTADNHDGTNDTTTATDPPEGSTFSCPGYGTPPDALGPFYIPETPWRRTLAPIEQITNSSLKLTVKGQVFSSIDCTPLPYILVEPWYAGLPDEFGDLYSSFGNTNFDYRARLLTDTCGKFKYTATFPQIYPDRPIRHIHYRFSTWNFDGGNDDPTGNTTTAPVMATTCGEDIPGSVGAIPLLVTQMYFTGYIIPGFNPDPVQIVDIYEDPTDGSKVVYYNVYLNIPGVEADLSMCTSIEDDATDEDYEEPTCSPTLSPTDSPTSSPSESPSRSHAPSTSPTITASPTITPLPSQTPSASPSDFPTLYPTTSAYPSISPSNIPTDGPTITASPSTIAPSTVTEARRNTSQNPEDDVGGDDADETNTSLNSGTNDASGGVVTTNTSTSASLYSTLIVLVSSMYFLM